MLLIMTGLQAGVWTAEGDKHDHASSSSLSPGEQKVDGDCIRKGRAGLLLVSA